METRSVIIFVLFLQLVASQIEGPFDPETVCEGNEDDEKVGFGADVSCVGYYYCYGGVGEAEECPEGQQFDYNINDCDDAENVQCEDPNGGGDYTDYPDYGETDYTDDYGEETEASTPGTTRPPPTLPTRQPPGTTSSAGSTASTTPNPNQIDDVTCPTNRPGEIIFFPSSNCTEYFICANGNKLRMSCMEGFTWNQDEKQCDFPIFSKCSSDLSVDGENVQCRRNGFYSTAYPRDCKKFVFCSNGIPIIQNCPIGYAWSNDRCVLREFVICPDLKNRF